MIVAVVNTKGGVAKTTSSVHLATALSRHGRTALFDADPQGSASDWGQTAEAAGTPLPFDLSIVNQRVMARLASGYEYVVIDTPPGHPQTIDAAIAVADIVLIPTETSPLDIQRVWSTLEVVVRAGKPAAVLLVKTRPKTRSLAAAIEALEEADLALIATHIPLREDIKNSFGTVPAALFGYDTVATDLMEAHNAINAQK